MSKRRFIQGVVVRSLPSMAKLPEAVKYAEELWEGLSALGYGSETREHRVSKDYITDLSERQRVWFLRFWKAFAYTKGKNGAAMRWAQLGELSDAEFGHIVYAAGKEADKPLAPGLVRMYAQGWLFEKRFNDFAPKPTASGETKEQVLRRLNGELTHLEMLYAANKSAALKEQQERLVAKIAEVMRS